MPKNKPPTIKISRDKPAPSGSVAEDLESVEVTLTRFEQFLVQDAVDDYATDAGASAKGEDARRLRALQRKFHAFTGEEMPFTKAQRRASLRRLLKKGG